MLHAIVHRADIQDRDGGILLLATLFGMYPFLKTLFADVPPLMIEAHGAVSKEVAIALADNIREICNADIGVGVTGIAGPTGGTEEKPVGLVWVAVSDGTKQETAQRRFPGDRERIRRWASQQALDLVRRMVM